MQENSIESVVSRFVIALSHELGIVETLIEIVLFNIFSSKPGAYFVGGYPYRFGRFAEFVMGLATNSILFFCKSPYDAYYDILHQWILIIW